MILIIKKAFFIATLIFFCSMYDGIGTSISFKVAGFNSFWFVEPSPFFSSSL